MNDEEIKGIILANKANIKYCINELTKLELWRAEHINGHIIREEKIEDRIETLEHEKSNHIACTKEHILLSKRINKLEKLKK